MLKITKQKTPYLCKNADSDADVNTESENHSSKEDTISLYQSYNNLTRQEYQFLTLLLSKELTKHYNNISELREFEKYFWDKANPFDPETIKAFKNLNRIRGHIRKEFSKVRKLERIQKKIKMYLS